MQRTSGYTRLWIPRFGLGLLCCSSVALLDVLHAAQELRSPNRKLSGSMVQRVVGDVHTALFSPDDGRVAYRFYNDETGRGTLWVVVSDGSGVPLLLTPEDHRIIDNFRWSPDGTRLLYFASEGFDHGLFSVPADGSQAPLRIDSPGLGPFLTSSDGTRVVYVVAGELRSAPLDGSAPPLRLNGPVTPGHGVPGSGFAAEGGGFALAGARVVFTSDEQVSGHHELYSVPVDGSAAPIQISHTSPLVTLTPISFRVDPTSTRAVYIALGGTRNDLYSTPVDGSGAAVKLNPAFPSGRRIASYLLTPDGASVVYRADQNADERYELFRVPLDGSSAAVPLTPLPAGSIRAEWISPDGVHVLFNGRTTSALPDHLFSVRTDGSAAPVLLEAAFGSIEANSLRITPDSSTVLYFEPKPGGGSDVFGVAIAGGSAPRRISDTAAGGQVSLFRFTPDSQQLVYLADAAVPGRVELFRAPIHPAGGPDGTLLSGPLAASGDVRDFQLDSLGVHALYVADETVDERFELFRTALAGPALPHLVVQPLPTEQVGDVNSFLVRNGRVVYAADQDTDGRIELFGVPADGHAPAVRLSGPFVAGGNVLLRPPQHPAFELTADGSRVAFVADAETDEAFELFSAPTDGSSPAVKLNGALSAGTDIRRFGFRFTPDGARVVYLADQAQNPGKRLYSVPSQGGTPLPFASTTGGSFEITADSARVVYVDSSLFLVPVDGSAAPLDLSGSVSSIAEFRTTSTRVVYRAVVAGQTQLFTVPLAGGTPFRLNGPLVGGGNVVDFALDPGETRVVFRADAYANQRYLLFCAPLDGSSAPRVLNGPLIAGGDVVEFAIAPGGSRVVYTADQFEDHLFNPFSVPIDGSAPPVRLLAANVSSLDSFQITPDGASVLIGSDSSGGRGLRSIPIEGGSPVQLAPAPFFGTSWFRVTADGRSVVYYEYDEPVRGLYSVPLVGGGIERLTPSFVARGALAVQYLQPGGNRLYFPFQCEAGRVVYCASQERPSAFELYSSFPRRFAPQR